MTRQATFLAILAGLLIAVAFWFLLFQPGQEELAAVEEEVDQVLAQQDITRLRIQELQQVRAEATQIQADITRAAAIVPGDPAVPATLRQIQAAADDSGLFIETFAPGAPIDVAEVEFDLAALNLTMAVEGSYFQIVDFLRRLENPDIVARGVLIDTISLAPADYPALTGSITARLFTTVPAPPEVEVEEVEEDVDVDVDVEVDADEADESSTEDEA